MGKFEDRTGEMIAEPSRGKRSETKYMLSHPASRQFAWAKLGDDDGLWHVDFRGEHITMPDLSRIGELGFTFASASGSSSVGGEILPMPKTVERKYAR